MYIASFVTVFCIQPLLISRALYIDARETSTFSRKEEGSVLESNHYLFTPGRRYRKEAYLSFPRESADVTFRRYCSAFGLEGIYIGSQIINGPVD